MKARIALIFATALTTVALFAAGEDHPVTIKQLPPKITRRPFDRKRPPPQMPKLTAAESGVCHFEVTCDAGIGFLVDTIDPHTVEVEVDSVDAVLSLPIDVWVGIGTPPKLGQHEEGHRQICEDYYKGADVIARDLAKAMIGKKARATGRDKKDAQARAQDQLLTQYNAAYMHAVRDRMRQAQDHYDLITIHGLKPIAEKDAIAQAEALVQEGKIPPPDPSIK
ncbi:MAG TPA: hypothetical protein VGM73_01655 [Candidatus Didemnitutus sp.]|jgi:hypothetical protein